MLVWSICGVVGGKGFRGICSKIAGAARSKCEYGMGGGR